MRKIAFLSLALCVEIGLCCARGHAESACTPATDMKKELEAAGARWTTLSPDQWQFMRGVYSGNPPMGGVPFGDGAAMVQHGSDKGAVIFFVDGVMACEPMGVSADLVATLMDLGTIKHLGHGS